MNKTLIAIAILAAIAIAIIVFFGVIQIPFGQNNALSDTSGVDEDTFISYIHPLGFNLSHPFWFKRQEFNNATDPVKLTLTASSSEGYGEAISVALYNETVEELKSLLKADLGAEERSTLLEYEAFNAKMMRFETDSGVGGMIVQSAFFSCGNYNAVLTAAVPWELEDDLKAMNAVTKTFKC